MKRLAFEVPDLLHRQIEALVQAGEFRDPEEVVNVALHYWLDVHRRKPPEMRLLQEAHRALCDRERQPPVVDLDDEEAYADAHAIRKLIHLVLLMALKDRGSEVRFEPGRDEVMLGVEIEGV